MQLSARIGDWFLNEMTAMAMVEAAEHPDMENLQSAIVGLAVAATIRASLGDPEWAHQLARAVDQEIPSVSTSSWARRFAGEFGGQL